MVNIAASWLGGLDTLMPAGLKLSHVALTLVLIVVSWLLASTLRGWSRLRGFPGPTFASFSYLWGYFAMKDGRMHQRVAEEQAKYGKLMRIGPNELMVYDPETLWQINSVRSEYGRGAWYNSIQFDPYGHSVLSEPNTQNHDKRKAKISSGYSGKGGIDLERDLDSQLAIMTDIIRKKYASTDDHNILDFGRIIRFFQVDLITLVGSGKPWGSLSEETDKFDFISIADTFVPFLHSFMMIPMLRNLFSSKFFLKLAGPKPTDANGMGRFLGIVKNTVAARFNGVPEEKTRPKDMLDEWIRHDMTARECELELAVQVPAGSETATTAIRGIMLHILSTPRVYQKLKDEIHQGIQDGTISNPITNEEAKKLPYLQNILSEGLRMVSPAITGFPKRVPAGGDTICGKYVPEGTDIFVNMWSMLRNQEVFGKDADLFYPERFTECTDAAKLQKMYKTLDLAFGHGRWLCPGKVLAQMELNKIFVQLLREFDLQIANPENPWKCRGYSSFLIDDFYIKVTKCSE